MTAGDIEAPSDIEIINPELQLLTLDTLDSELEIELMVSAAMGYSPSEERKNLPIGEIPVDAIFSPVVKVGYQVEPARIEQITNYDLLKLEIWTDGTIEPAAALSQAARILIQHMTPVAQFTGEETARPVAEALVTTIASEYYDVPIEELELQMRAYNCLQARRHHQRWRYARAPGKGRGRDAGHPALWRKVAGRADDQA